jgi:hypothetical protein
MACEPDDGQRLLVSAGFLSEMSGEMRPESGGRRMIVGTFGMAN